MLPQIPQDKANHHIYGEAIYIVARLAFYANGYFSPHVARQLSILVVAVIAGLKEGSDYLLNKRAIKRGENPPHEVSYMDFLATMSGVVIPYIAEGV